MFLCFMIHNINVNNYIFPNNIIHISLDKLKLYYFNVIFIMFFVSYNNFQIILYYVQTLLLSKFILSKQQFK